MAEVVVGVRETTGVGEVGMTSVEAGFVLVAVAFVLKQDVKIRTVRKLIFLRNFFQSINYLSRGPLFQSERERTSFPGFAGDIQ